MLRAAHAQHPGGRSSQQDAVFAEPGFYALADGNGLLGDCSAKAIELFRHHLHETGDLAQAVRRADTDLCANLTAAIATAVEGHPAIGTLGLEFFESRFSSGTTLVALVEHDGATHVVHVGDSRAYRVSPARSSLVQLTRDHVWPEDDETVDIDGTIYKHGLAMQRVLGHPQLRALGVTSEPDIAQVTLADDELFLLCSDGLVPFLTERPARFFELLARPLDEAARAIADEAGAEGGDNVSLILVAR